MDDFDPMKPYRNVERLTRLMKGQGAAQVYGGFDVAKALGGYDASKAFGGALEASKALGGYDASKAFGGALEASKALGAYDTSKAFGGALEASKALGTYDATKPLGGIDLTKLFGSYDATKALGGVAAMSSFIGQLEGMVRLDELVQATGAISKLLEPMGYTTPISDVARYAGSLNALMPATTAAIEPDDASLDALAEVISTLSEEALVAFSQGFAMVVHLYGWLTANRYAMRGKVIRYVLQVAATGCAAYATQGTNPLALGAAVGAFLLAVTDFPSSKD